MPKNKKLGRGRVMKGTGRGRDTGYKEQLEVTLAEVECLAVIDSIDQQLLCWSNRNRGMEGCIT